MKVLILGSTGMLGSMVLKYLSTKKELDITAPTREELGKIKYNKYDYIINCIGIIKQKLTDPKEAILINSLFSHTLSEKAPDAKIIQIATDCVYSGKKGHYTEDDPHDALDVYGKTKSLGEVEAKNFYNIRTSIIGLEPNSKKSLLGWFLSQPKNANVNGYTNHYWNGITTFHFAKLCYVIIKGAEIPNLFHFIPADIVSKYELLKIFSEKFNRKDVHIEKFEADFHDRSLTTVYKINEDLWKAMGYDTALTIEDMIEDMLYEL